MVSPPPQLGALSNGLFSRFKFNTTNHSSEVR
jgi:hypothetical protein